MTMTRKKCWICGRPVYSKISDICRPCEQAWRVLVLKEREKDNIDDCYGCIWKGTHRDLFPCSECRGSGKEGPDWYSPAGEPLVYRDDASAGETEKDSSDLISRKDAIDAVGYEIDNGYNAIVKRINSLPSVKRRTGKWIPKTVTVGGKEYIEYARCSVCGAEIIAHFDVCPNCWSYNGGVKSE